MFSWLKNLFSKKPEPLVLTNPIKYKEEVKITERPPAPTPTKPNAPRVEESATNETKIDLDSMNKTQLLAEAKRRGVKANASLKKNEIVERIKNGD